MAIDRTAAIKHLGDVLGDYQQTYDDFSGMYARSPGERAYVQTRLLNALRRLAPPGSEHEKGMQGIDATNACCVDELAGLVRALKADYEGDCVDCYRELFNAELFSDFLQMAEYLLLDERLMQPAAVLAGGVLEEHLRKLCGKYGINASTKDAKGREVPKKVDVMNAELCKEGVYSKNDQKQVTAWCGIRNSAAHAKYDEFDDSQVEQMTQGIRSFISRYPA